MNSMVEFGKNFVCDGTIIQALDQEYIDNEKENNKNLSFFQKVQLGSIHGVKRVVQGMGLLWVVSSLIESIMDSNTTNSEKLSYTKIVVIGAVAEELVFRGGLQNVISCTQRFANYVAPTVVKENRVFKWLTSSSCRIITTQTVFALMHLDKAGKHISTAKTTASVVRMMIQPNMSILYETTGSLAAPIACHMTNNLIALIAHKNLGS